MRNSHFNDNLIALMSAGEQFFFYKNLPIKWVRIVGLVVAIDDFAGRRVFTIDDSSGACIEVLETLVATSNPKKATQNCTAGDAKEPTTAALLVTKISAYPDIDVGQVVEVKGGLSEFREERQITIEKLLPVRSTMEEVILWEKRAKFRDEVLGRTWVISPRDLRKAKKEAERDKVRTEKKYARASEREHPKAAQYGTGSSTASSRQQKQPLVQQPVNLRELLRDSKGKFGALGL